MSRNPAFTFVAVLSLALGIGANTAIFQVIDAIRLRTLPVSNPGELAEVRLVDPNGAPPSDMRDEPRASQTSAFRVFTGYVRVLAEGEVVPWVAHGWHMCQPI